MKSGSRPDTQRGYLRLRGLEAPVHAVIFDFDGVLADTEGLHWRTFTEVLRERGLEPPPGTTPERFLGVTDRDAFRAVFEELGADAGEAAVASAVRRKAELYRARAPEVPLFPGALRVLREAAARVPITIASSGGRGDIEAILQARGLSDFFPSFVSGDEIERSKPAPDAFLKALEILKEAAPALRPEDCLVVEDSAHGLEAARRAGMRCAAVLHSLDEEALRGADLILEDLAEFLARLR